MGGPAVSVVVPTFDRRARLQRVLAALAAQETDVAFEVIVVSDGSTDGTDEYLDSGAPPLPVLARRQENAGPAVARNRGVEVATGDLVLFVDDDLVPSPGLVARHVVEHRAATCSRTVVIGPMLDPPDHVMTPWVAWEQAMLTKQYDAMTAGLWRATARQFFSGNASLPRSLFVDAGGFDPAYRRLEDIELGYRLDDLGTQWVFAPDAYGHHYAERSYESWISTAFEYGRNEVRLARRQERPHVLDTIAAEQRRRHPAIRGLLWATDRRPGLSAGLARTTRRWVMSPGARLAPRATRGLLSAAYNDAYHRGVVTELGAPAPAESVPA